ncbi:MAG: SpoIIE family protein phosphatase [Acidobacteriia bacterium]|nr:SpoIIE family protein phosphatase [Terriglobia bacterium]
MDDRPRILRVIVASPGDVEAERELVPVIADELNRSVAADRGLRLEVVRWETDSFPGFDPGGPQGLIDKALNIAGSDILIGIFWKRFGTPVPGAQSGTEHEFRLAYDAWKRQGRPQVMMYFNDRPYKPKSKEEAYQWGAVLEFQKEFPKEGMWWSYKGPASLERLLRRHLENYLRAAFPLATESGKPAAAPEPPLPAASDYFAVQSRIIDAQSRMFVGRADALSAFDRFLASHAGGYFLVKGAPGQGKTALACRLVKTGGHLHHLIARTGGRSDTRLILRSLIAQLAFLLGRSGAAPESIPELTKAYEELLAEAAARRQPVVVVIDALDELPAGAIDELPFLPVDALPDGVFLVASSRPGDHLSRLEQRLFATPHCVFELGPLGIDEIRELLAQTNADAGPMLVDRIATTSQGNPLFLLAIIEELRTNPRFDARELPASIEGFFQRATASLGAGNAVLGDVLGVLSASRRALSAGELSAIIGRPQRETADQGIGPVKQFLLETDGRYTFYHSRFHEFVNGSVLYQDELRHAHQWIAAWLEKEVAGDYRLDSLAWHLYEARDCEGLIRKIDPAFLTEKLRRSGYAVLEDVDLWTRCMLDRGDPDVIERCIAVVESLRREAGGDIIKAVANGWQPYRSAAGAFRSRLMEPPTPAIPRLEIYAGVLPKAEMPADFFELVPLEGRLAAAIGDAPAIGLKSSFVARFMAGLYRTLAARSVHPGELLQAMHRSIDGREYFRGVTMQCVEVDPAQGLVRIASAAHPFPVHYSARRRRCDNLPVTGDLLVPADRAIGVSGEYQEGCLEIEEGDLLVLVTDGLTEAPGPPGESFGQRLPGLIERHAHAGARVTGEKIMDAWKEQPREEDVVDDVTVIVISIGGPGGARRTTPL